MLGANAFGQAYLGQTYAGATPTVPVRLKPFDQPTPGKQGGFDGASPHARTLRSR